MYLQSVHQAFKSVLYRYKQKKEGDENMLNKNLLVSKMKLHGDNQEDLAKWIGLSTQRFNAKLNGTGGAEFTQSEILRIKEKYNLTAEEIDKIFFDKDVS